MNGGLGLAFINDRGVKVKRGADCWQSTDPKSIAFNAAIFSTAAPAQVSPPTFVATLTTVGSTATYWYGAVALLLSHAVIATTYRGAKRWIDRVCGTLIIALGIRQALR